MLPRDYGVTTSERQRLRLFSYVITGSDICDTVLIKLHAERWSVKCIDRSCRHRMHYASEMLLSYSSLNQHTLDRYIRLLDGVGRE